MVTLIFGGFQEAFEQQRWVVGEQRKVCCGLRFYPMTKSGSGGLFVTVRIKFKT